MTKKKKTPQDAFITLSSKDGLTSYVHEAPTEDVLEQRFLRLERQTPPGLSPPPFHIQTLWRDRRKREGKKANKLERKEKLHCAGIRRFYFGTGSLALSNTDIL